MENLVPEPQRINNNDKGWSVRSFLNQLHVIFTDAINKLYKEKVDRSEIANLSLGIKDYKDDVTNISDLPITGNTQGDARVVSNDKDDNGHSYIWLWNGTSWSRTVFTTLPSDVALAGGSNKTVQEIDQEKAEKVDFFNLRATTVGLTLTPNNLIKGHFYRGNEIGTSTALANNVAAAYLKVAINPKQWLNITATGNTQAPPLIFVDKNDIILYKSNPSLSNIDIQSPLDTAYAIFNNYPYSDNFSVCINNFDNPSFVGLNYKNLISDMKTVDGYYTSNNSLITNKEFIAIENFVSVKPRVRYIYVGKLFGDMAIPLFDNLKTVVGAITINSEFVRKIEIASKSFEMIEFVTPENVNYLKISTSKNYPSAFALYENGLDTNISEVISCIQNIETKMDGFRFALKDLIRGHFYRGNQIGTSTTLGNNTAAAYLKVAIKEGQRVKISSAGNSQAPPLMFVDKDDIILSKSEDNVTNFYTIAPLNTAYVIFNNYPYSEDFFAEISSLIVSITNPKWTIPKTLYCIKGQEKSIYLNNLININDDAPNYSVSVNKTFGEVDNRRFFFTPNSLGLKSIIMSAWNNQSESSAKQNLNFEILDNVLFQSKRILLIGDSITESLNMAYYVQECLKASLTEDSLQPIFVGSKGGLAGMGGKPTCHEGWYGRSYQWLAGDQVDTSQPSPFINPKTNILDIPYYRTKILGLQNDQYINVVSLAMGFNNTGTENNARKAFTSMQKIITAFKQDYVDTKFVIQLVTYPAEGNVAQVDSEERVEKKNSLYFFRQLCLDTYGNNQDSNIFIGDLGLVYDRWYAYPRVKRIPSKYYSDEIFEIVTDRVHPNINGTKQMGEGITACILKMLQ